MSQHNYTPEKSSTLLKYNKKQPDLAAKEQQLQVLRKARDLAKEDSLTKLEKPKNHEELLEALLEQIEPLDYREKAGLGEEEKLTRKHYHVITIEQILELAKQNNWGLSRHNETVYLFNGCFWSMIEDGLLMSFLGEAGEKMGMDKYQARHYLEKDSLVKQFFSSAHMHVPIISESKVLVNLQNGTFEITDKDTRLRNFATTDFLTYQLPFLYDPQAKAPLFEAYLDKVLPDKALQDILLEYLGYVFVMPGTLKLEKVLLLYGSGANGKSVFFEIVNALLGPENISCYSLQSLTNDNSYSRAKLENKLVNYGSEINGRLEASIFKQLASGEPVEARLPYGQPFTLSRYAKLIFNCNELPKEVEHTNAYYRRFLIVPFNVTIPEAEQDKELAKKIIEKELSGIFNLALKGLRRLLAKKAFTHSPLVDNLVNDYRKQSDSVQMFLDENEYSKSLSSTVLLRDLYVAYRQYCYDDGCLPVSKAKLRKRLVSAGIVVNRTSKSYAVYLSKPE